MSVKKKKKKQARYHIYRLICVFFPCSLLCLPFNPLNPLSHLKSCFIQFDHRLYSTGVQLNPRQCFFALTVQMLARQTDALLFYRGFLLTKNKVGSGLKLRVNCCPFQTVLHVLPVQFVSTFVLVFEFRLFPNRREIPELCEMCDAFLPVFYLTQWGFAHITI